MRCLCRTNRGCVPRRCAFHTVPGRKIRGLVCASIPRRHDGLDALLRTPGAEGVDTIGPVGAQTGPRPLRPGLPRHAQAQGAVPSIREEADQGCGRPPRLRSKTEPILFWGRVVRAQPCCPTARWTDPGWSAYVSSGAAKAPAAHQRHKGTIPRRSNESIRSLRLGIKS